MTDFDDFLNLTAPRQPKQPKKAPSGGPVLTDNEIAARIRQMKEADWHYIGDRLVLRRQHCDCCGSLTTYVHGVVSVERDRKSGTLRKSFNRGGSTTYLALDPVIEDEVIPMCPQCLIYTPNEELDSLFGQVFEQDAGEQLTLRF